MMRKVRKLFIPVMQIVALLLGIFLTYQAHVHAQELNEAYRIETVAVLPFQDSSKIGMENFVKDEIREVLINEVKLFQVIEDAKVKELTTMLKIRASKPLTKDEFVTLKKNLQLDSIFYGNVIKLGKRLKIIIKFRNLKTMEELSAETVNVDGWYSPESIADEIKKAVLKIVHNFPYNGIITNTNNTDLVIRIDTSSFREGVAYIRLIKLKEVEKNSLIRGRIIGFKKEEIGVIEVSEVNLPLITGKLRYIKPGYNASLASLIDFGESTLTDQITNEVPVVPVASVTPEQNVAEAPDDILLERIPEDEQLVNSEPSPEPIAKASADPNVAAIEQETLNLDEVEKEYNDDHMIQAEAPQSTATQADEKDNSSYVVSSENNEDKIYGRHFFMEKRKHGFSLVVGLSTGMIFNNYGLESNGTVVVPGGVKTNGIYDFGLVSTFIYKRYFGADLVISQGYLKNTVELGLDEPQKILITKRKVKFNLIGRLPILRKNPLSPYIDVRLGYGYFTIDYDEIRVGDEDQLAYLTSQLYHGGIATVLAGFPIIENRLSLEGSFSYWILPTAKETPEGASGTDPLADAYSFGGASTIRVYKNLSIGLGYEFEYFHVDYLGKGSRFLQEVSKANSFDRYHNIFVSFLYRFF